jgi:hypothetical protein
MNQIIDYWWSMQQSMPKQQDGTFATLSSQHGCTEKIYEKTEQAQ